jgi:hypothetical protein
MEDKINTELYKHCPLARFGNGNCKESECGWWHTIAKMCSIRKMAGDYKPSGKPLPLPTSGE